MLTRIYTAILQGLSPILVEVEIDAVRGLPGFTIIGLPSKAISEAKERVTAAVQHCGVRIRSRKTVVNLAPADLHKTGSNFELAIAVGLLKMYGEIELDTSQTLFFGELSLDGRLKPLRSALPLVLAAQELGFKHVVIPVANLAETAQAPGINIVGIDHLRQMLGWGNSARHLPASPAPQWSAAPPSTTPAWQNVVGHDDCKRALALAVAGGHHILLTGPAGSGKTTLAEGCQQLLPPLSKNQALAVTRLYSLAQTMNSLISQPPFRQPHHTISRHGLVGGTAQLKPGEVSLAHHGILFLDELSEFPPEHLETLRQPLENKVVHLTRVSGTVTYPADFMLVAATNPCACGHYGDPQLPCRCGPATRERYRRRISTPLLDRFDLHLWVAPVPHHQFAQPPSVGAYSAAQIATVRERQGQRWQTFGFALNAAASWQQLVEAGNFEPEALALLTAAGTRFGLSNRGLLKCARVARTIADFDQKKQVTTTEVAEALQYRPTIEATDASATPPESYPGSGTA